MDYNISSAMVMAVASEYYVYSVTTLCGIPKIKINGKKEDWNIGGEYTSISNRKGAAM